MNSTPARETSFSQRGGYEFSLDPNRLERSKIHSWLSKETYWATGRSAATMNTAIDSSRNYGVYLHGTGAQVAYARVITDNATFAWLCDVFVIPEGRGRGIGKLLISGIMDDLAPLRLKRIMLATHDAHDLYATYGFTALPDPSLFMLNDPLRD